MNNLLKKFTLRTVGDETKVPLWIFKKSTWFYILKNPMNMHYHRILLYTSDLYEILGGLYEKHAINWKAKHTTVIKKYIFRRSFYNYVILNVKIKEFLRLHCSLFLFRFSYVAPVQFPFRWLNYFLIKLACSC